MTKFRVMVPMFWPVEIEADSVAEAQDAVSAFDGDWYEEDPTDHVDFRVPYSEWETQVVGP